MREILFRGKRVDNGEWVEGFYYKQNYFFGNEVEKHIIITSSDALTNDFDLDFYEVIPETLGQFTGLTDKNGKRIFEGDVVCEELYRENKGVVKFGEGTFDGGAYPYIGFFYEDILGYTDHNSLYFSAYNPFIVLGNIHDNPELLAV